jgi:uncharacterized protein (DUF433 family)
MNWQEYISSDPDVLVGKPVIKGTRISVDFILDLLAQGWTEQDLLDNYPSISKSALQATFAFALECMRDEKIYKMN